ncbi:hypothetical protein COLO4_19398 [Corchorus olitorius]|uniref:Uncharacterized protein n=1 Tax=Corchorus olitorius TaxID=93759 RepID=A0A1R3J5M2_9ROSI|nr:hypothetical protein COLO4_19398 [Corchorus olitorius]
MGFFFTVRWRVDERFWSSSFLRGKFIEPAEISLGRRLRWP